MLFRSPHRSEIHRWSHSSGSASGASALSVHPPPLFSERDVYKRQLGHNKSAIDKCFVRTFPGNLVTFCQLITLVNKAMIGSDDKMIGVAADGDSMNQIHNFLNGFLTRMKHLILGICLVSTRVDLIMRCV